MKWLVGFLVVLNAGLFLWGTGHDPGRPASASAYPVVSAESMRLLREVRKQKAPESDDARGCARIGPFISSAVASLAEQKLQAMSLNYSRRTVKSREIRAFRVFLGPFESQSAVDTQRKLLESAGITDYYVKRDEQGGGAVISLGLFSQRNGAEALLNRLQRGNVQATMRTEDRVLNPNYWLEIEDSAVSGGIPPELAGASWGEKSAQVRRYDCS